MTLLERRKPTEYGKRMQTDVNLSGQVASVNFSTDDLQTALSAAKEFEEMFSEDDEDEFDL